MEDVKGRYGTFVKNQICVQQILLFSAKNKTFADFSYIYLSFSSGKSLLPCFYSASIKQKFVENTATNMRRRFEKLDFKTKPFFLFNGGMKCEDFLRFMLFIKLKKLLKHMLLFYFFIDVECIYSLPQY